MCDFTDLGVQLPRPFEGQVAVDRIVIRADALERLGERPMEIECLAVVGERQRHAQEIVFFYNQRHA